MFDVFDSPQRQGEIPKGCLGWDFFLRNVILSWTQCVFLSRAKEGALLPAQTVLIKIDNYP